MLKFSLKLEHYPKRRKDRSEKKYSEKKAQTLNFGGLVKIHQLVELKVIFLRFWILLLYFGDYRETVGDVELFELKLLRFVFVIWKLHQLLHQGFCYFVCLARMNHFSPQPVGDVLIVCVCKSDFNIDLMLLWFSQYTEPRCISSFT